MRFDPKERTVTLSLEEAVLLKRAAWDGPDPSPEEIPVLEALLTNIERVQREIALVPIRARKTGKPDRRKESRDGPHRRQADKTRARLQKKT
jgi:hypothetical protein